MESPQVLVVGSFNQDLTWNTPEFPKPGETVTGRFTSGPGGKGSNQAVAAARAGAATAFVGAIGRDPFGDALPAFYDGEGIRHHLAVKEDLPTGNAGIWVSGSGQNEIIVALGSNLALAPADVPDGLFDSARIVICQHESNLEINRYVFGRGRAAGAATFLNPAPMRDDFDPSILELVDIFAPNETEFAALINQMGFAPSGGFSEKDLGAMDAEALHGLCRKFGVPCMVVTLGSRGCFVSTESRSLLIPACKGIKVVDTTGAGDAFVGGFSAGYVRYGGDVFKAAAFGNATAALSVTKPGTAPSMPRKAEIEALKAKMESGEC